MNMINVRLERVTAVSDSRGRGSGSGSSEYE